MKSVKPEENEKLMEPIKLQEIAEFIKTLSPHKAPGITGLTSAFYTTFWTKIKTLVLNATNSILLETKRLPNRQNIGIITLIPKQDKDQRHIGNLRPITLLSTFYKIISGIITNRLKPIFDRLINPWQKAYLPGRYIAEVTRTTYDIFAHAKHNNLPGLLLLVDFSKAFDSISFEYINQVLEKFGFNQQTIGWINILLYNFESIAMVNGVPPPPWKN